MEYPLEALLDACVTQLKTGADLEEILEEYPDAADELRPLLAAAAWAALNVPPLRNAQLHKRELMALAETRRRLVESVDGYVNEVRAGVPYPDLVARAPEAMAPVLLAAWRMKTTDSPQRDPARVAAGKERVMALAAERRRTTRVPANLRTRVHLGDILAAARPRPSVVRRLRTTAASGVASAALFVGLIGVNTAAAGSIPGQPFYGVKRLGEAAQLYLAADAGQRAELNLQFSGRRLGEIRMLTESGRAVPSDLAADWLRGHHLAWEDALRLPLDQRALLTEMILASLEQSPSGMNATGIVASDSGSLAASLRRSLGVADTAPQESTAPPPSGGPVAGPRPLPSEDTRSAAEPAAVPVVEPPAADEPAAVDSAPIVAPVVSAPGGGDGDDDPGSADAGAGPPIGEPPAAEVEPPAFGAPPVAPSPDEPGTPDQP